uniref:Expansin-like EG45 domain-containing protein n=1 Tax=Kalanchoe fedtschenkoi TaxID=63787 RepID=A0A7N0TFZ6_KALFE
MKLLLLTIQVASFLSMWGAYGDIGTATAYNPPYVPTLCYGHRHDKFPPGSRFVAVSEGLWDNGAACGRKYRLRCLSGPERACKKRTIDVTVVDLCPHTKCPSSAALALSNKAFASISRCHGDQRIIVEYMETF